MCLLMNVVVAYLSLGTDDSVFLQQQILKVETKAGVGFVDMLSTNV